MKILLIGNPNVGKSVIFTRLTGVNVISSNYPGTTIDYTQGFMKVGNQKAEVVDVPGAYTLEPTNAAEEIALAMLDSGDVIINVIDATHLERNLYLTLQLLEKHVPTLIALNMWDEAKHLGVHINLKKLENLLGVPVIPTAAVTGEGVKTLVESISKAVPSGDSRRTRDQRWARVGDIVEQVQHIVNHRHTWRESLADASVMPISGSIIALLVLIAAFFIIRFIGESLIAYIFDPLFDTVWLPVLSRLSSFTRPDGFLHQVLIGKLMNGEIDFVESFGLLSSGLYVPFGMVLPYIVSFYLVIGLFEDSGYLPRLSVLMDTVMHRFGLHGYAIIPTLLGFGCNVPAVLATRILENERERFIAATLISIAVPCAALQAMVINLAGKHGLQYVAIVYGTLFFVWIGLGLILRFTVKGFTPELLIEIPPYRLPPWRTVLHKLWMRVFGFLREAVPVILGAVLVVNLLYFSGMLNALADWTAPIISNILGLPKEAVIGLVIGFLRKDIAIGMLAPLGLSAKQTVVGCVVLAMFFPCIATFVVLFRELGVRDTLKSIAIMIVSAITVGAILNQAL